jgi:hypothetical protein
MKTLSALIFLLVALYQSEGDACPKSKDLLLPPKASFYINSVKFIPGCSASDKECTGKVASLVLKGEFVVDSSEDTFLLGIWTLPDAVPHWEDTPKQQIKIRQSPDDSPDELRGDPFFSRFEVIERRITIKDTAELPISTWKDGLHLGLAAVTSQGKSIGTKRVINANKLGLSEWEPEHERPRPCLKDNFKALPKVPKGLPVASAPTSIPMSQPTSQAASAPSTEPVVSIDSWWAQHQGEILASQLAMFLIALSFLVVRRARGLVQIMVFSLLAGVFWSVLSFIVIAELLPLYARDIAPIGRQAVAPAAMKIAFCFGWMGGALLALVASVLYLIRFTPSMDLKERAVFTSSIFIALFVPACALWHVEVTWLFITAGCLALALAMYSAWLSKQRLAWYRSLHKKEIEGLQVIEKKEPNIEMIHPVFYHSEDFAYTAFVSATPKHEEPYRENAAHLWLTSFDEKKEAAPVRKRIVMGVVIGLLVLGWVIGVLV